MFRVLCGAFHLNCGCLFLHTTVCSRKYLRQVVRWVNVYRLNCFAPVYWKAIITNMNVIGKVSSKKPESSCKIEYEFKRRPFTHLLYISKCRLDFTLQKRLKRDRLYKNTPNDGYKGLEMCLRSIPTERLKNFTTNMFFFSDQRNLFYALTIEARQQFVSTSEIVICSYCLIIY